MEWVKKEDNYNVPIKSWCADIDEMALKQAQDLAMHPVVFRHVALMPDCHPGYGMPIGGVIAALDAVIPNAVGVDIGCGMGSLKTNIAVSETSREKLRQVVELIKKSIPSGEGRAHKTEQPWEGLDDIDCFSGRGWFNSHVKKLAKKNLGTLGGGNHFIEIQAGDDDNVWLMIHSGSRNLGNVIARFYNDIAVRLNEKWFADTPGKDLAFLPCNIQEGQDYITDMNFALCYARQNRKRIMDRFKDCFAQVFPNAKFSNEVNIHHNYAVLENHFGKNVWVHRKGATSAQKGETGIIPGSMGTCSYLVEGLANPDSFMSCSHGAGRVMGRLEATRKLTPEACDQAMQNVVYDRWNKVRRGKAKGMYDLGEAPGAYKEISAVIKAQLDLIVVLHKFNPLGVVKG